MSSMGWSTSTSSSSSIPRFEHHHHQVNRERVTSADHANYNDITGRAGQHLKFGSQRLSNSQRAFMESERREAATKALGKKKKGVRSVVSDEESANASSPSVDPSSTEFYRVTAFSTAENYDFSSLLPILQRRFILMPYIAEDVYHVRLTNPIMSSPQPGQQQQQQQSTSSSSSSDSTSDSNTDASSSTSALSNIGVQGEAFVFNNGTFVTWGASDAQVDELLSVVSRVSIQPYSEIEVEWFDYCEDSQQPGGIQGETIVIGYDLPAHQAKLAFASGLARSAKLASLENLLDAHLSKHRHIPHILLSGKKLPLGRSSVLRNLGELFSLRGQVNLHSELLDSPDFCWSSGKMEECFEKISRNLDVRPRISIFNKKLDYANELAEVLRNHLHEEHSLKLEWCIIILISVEIGFEIVHYLEKWREKEEMEAKAKAAEEAAALVLGAGVDVGGIQNGIGHDDVVEEEVLRPVEKVKRREDGKGSAKVIAVAPATGFRGIVDTGDVDDKTADQFAPDSAEHHGAPLEEPVVDQKSKAGLGRKLARGETLIDNDVSSNGEGWVNEEEGIVPEVAGDSSDIAKDEQVARECPEILASLASTVGISENHVDVACGSGKNGVMLERMACCNCGKDAVFSCPECELFAFCSSDKCHKEQWGIHKPLCKREPKIAILSDRWMPSWEAHGRRPAFKDPMSRIYSMNIHHRQLIWGSIEALDFINLSETETKLDEIRVLFSGSGDLRDTIVSINNLPDTFKGTLHIHLNEEESTIAARNLILLLLLVNPAAEELIDAAIGTWYSTRLTSQQLERIGQVIIPIIAAGPETCAWKFNNQTVIRLGPGSDTILKYMMQMMTDLVKLDLLEVQEEYHNIMCSNADIDDRERFMLSMEPYQRYAWDYHNHHGVLLPLGTDLELFTRGNPFLFDPIHGFTAPRGLDKLWGWNFNKVKASGERYGVPKNDIYGAMFFHVREQMKTFVDKLRKHKIEFHMSSVPPELFVDHDEEKFNSRPLFDRIYMSNIGEWEPEEVCAGVLISDFSSVLNTTVNPSSTIIMAYMNWCYADLADHFKQHPRLRSNAIRLSNEAYRTKYATDASINQKGFPQDFWSQFRIHLNTRPKPEMLNLWPSFWDYLMDVDEVLMAGMAAAEVALEIRGRNLVVPRRVGVQVGGDNNQLPVEREVSMFGNYVTFFVELTAKV
ncbi:hypothetical protein HDU76_003587 [Blyttiomyces sp. JEL0837]|nr:hypothetical protein HDU76_003587 [Blyttiomyces sp. JEL0837]